MLERLKTALVDSFVGAIALGWLFAQGVVRFVGILIEPLQRWVIQQQFWAANRINSAAPGPSLELALTQLLMSVLLLLIAFALLRWLYYPAAKEQDQEQAPDPEQEA
jgi:hypothetical protein